MIDAVAGCFEITKIQQQEGNDDRELGTKLCGWSGIHGLWKYRMTNKDITSLEIT